MKIIDNQKALNRDHGRSNGTSTSIWVLTTVLGLGLGMSLPAQSASQVAPAGAGETSRSLQGQQDQHQIILQASKMMGKVIKGAQGRKLGEVEDIALDLQNNRVAFVMVSIGGTLGVGKNLVAVPPQALSSVTPATDDLILTAGVESFEKAKTLQKDNLPEMNHEWVRDVYRGVGLQPGDDLSSPSRLVKASDVIGADVEDSNGKDIGEIKDIAINLKEGRAPYAILSYGGVLGLGEKATAIPLSIVSRKKGDNLLDNDELVIAASSEQIKNSREFKDQEWKNLGDRQYGEGVYSSYKVQPYWKTGAGVKVGANQFKNLDTNGDGFISRSELRGNEALGSSYDRLDANKDGRLDEGEFARFEAIDSSQGGSTHDHSGESADMNRGENSVNRSSRDQNGRHNDGVNPMNKAPRENR